MSWEVEATPARDSLKVAELSRSKDIANVVDETLAKFKSSEEFTALLKKDHDTGFDAEVEAIFYKIWTHYQDMGYAFSGGELIDLIREWIEEERLNSLTLHCHLRTLVLRPKMRQRSRLCRSRLLNSCSWLKWTR